MSLYQNPNAHSEILESLEPNPEESIVVFREKHAEWLRINGFIRLNSDLDTWRVGCSKTYGENRLDGKELSVWDRSYQDEYYGNLWFAFFPAVPRTLEVSVKMLVYLGVPVKWAPRILQQLSDPLKGKELEIPLLRAGPRDHAIWKLKQLPSLIPHLLSPDVLVDMSGKDHAIRWGSLGREISLESLLDSTPENKVAHIIDQRSTAICSLAIGSMDLECDVKWGGQFSKTADGMTTYYHLPPELLLGNYTFSANSQYQAELARCGGCLIQFSIFLFLAQIAA